MPGRRPISRAVVLAAAVAFAGGCGSSSDIKGEIPQDKSAAMLSNLDALQHNVQAGDCDQAQINATAFVTNVNNLPDSSGTELKSALLNAGRHLQELQSQQCQPIGTSGDQGQHPRPPPPTTTTPTTTFTPTTTTSTTTTTSSTTKPTGGEPGGPQGGGGGNPGGGGTPPGTDTSGGTGGTGGGAGAP